MQAKLPTHFYHEAHLVRILRMLTGTAPFFAHVIWPEGADGEKVPKAVEALNAAHAKHSRISRIESSGSRRSHRTFFASKPRTEDESGGFWQQEGAVPGEGTGGNFTQRAYLADVAGGDLSAVGESEWQDMLKVFLKRYFPGKAYSRWRSVTNSDHRLRGAGFRVTGGNSEPRQRDTMDPAPQGSDNPDKENDHNRKGHVMRCFQCNSKYHVIFSCPDASPAKKTLFTELLDVVVDTRFGVVGPDLSEGISPCTVLEFEKAAENMFKNGGDRSDPVKCRYTIADALPLSPDDGVPVIVDTGCPLSVSGTAALKVVCEARGLDYQGVLKSLRPSRRRFAFGETVLTSLGIAHAW